MDLNALVMNLANKGVDFRGFGKLYKKPMVDDELSFDAKPVYAYLCVGNSFKDANRKPITLSEKKIAEAVGMGEKRVRKALGELETRSYIKRKRHFNASSEYEIIEQEGGYGKIPRSLFDDTRQTDVSRAIYAVLASYARLGAKEVYPELKKMLKTLRIKSDNTYYKHAKLLLQAGYISKAQRHDAGSFSKCDYTLNKNPKELLKDLDLRELAVGSKNESGAFVSEYKVSFGEGARKTVTHAKSAIREVAETVKETVKETAAKAIIGARETITDLSNVVNTIKTVVTPTQDQFCVLYNTSRGDFKNAVLDELDGNNRLDYAYSANRAVNREAMTIAVHYLTNFENCKKRVDDDCELRLLNLANEAIIEMCTAKDTMKFNGSSVVYSRVVEKINEWTDGCRFVGGTLAKIAETAVEKYLYGEENAENGIRFPLRYMQSCVWDALATANLKVCGNKRSAEFSKNDKAKKTLSDELRRLEKEFEKELICG
ncbi:hypothetical protein AGMMS49975_22170 [Clostridia bacterium]|nr:hypothetical protein AGMMS49975_22170 [Clostridia bacterium]